MATGDVEAQSYQPVPAIVHKVGDGDNRSVKIGSVVFKGGQSNVL